MSLWCLQFSQKTNENNSISDTIVVNSNFLFVFCENWRYQKDITKLTDLYASIKLFMARITLLSSCQIIETYVKYWVQQGLTRYVGIFKRSLGVRERFLRFVMLLSSSLFILIESFCQVCHPFLVKLV